MVDRTPYLITNELVCFSCAFFYGHIVGTGIYFLGGGGHVLLIG